MFFVSVCTLGVSGSLSAATIFGVCGTGFTSNTCGTLAATTGAATDGNWVLSGGTAFVTDSSGFPIGSGNWAADNSSSSWVSPRGNEQTGSDPAVTYTYTETFTIPVGDVLSTAIISGLWGTDNSGILLLNGHQIATLPTTGSFNPLTAFSVLGSSGFFQTGANTLVAQVTNTTVVSGLRVSVNVATISTPEPASLGFMGLGLAGLGILGRRLRS
jgi:PEP-CTERM motif